MSEMPTQHDLVADTELGRAIDRQEALLLALLAEGESSAAEATVLLFPNATTHMKNATVDYFKSMLARHIATAFQAGFKLGTDCATDALKDAIEARRLK